MKQTVYINDFIRMFAESQYNNNFSRDGLYKLFDYLEDIEDSRGESLEVDLLEICCTYTEATVSDIANDYSLAEDQSVITWLDDQGLLIGQTCNNTIVYRQI